MRERESTPLAEGAATAPLTRSENVGGVHAHSQNEIIKYVAEVTQCLYDFRAPNARQRAARQL
jgi:hypothetical protein